MIFTQIFILLCCIFFAFGCTKQSNLQSAKIASEAKAFESGFELGILDVKTTPPNKAQMEKIKKILAWAQKYNFETYFPTTIYGLYLAPSLNLRTDGGINELPDELDALTHLRSLDLGFANFTQLPTTICRLILLKELNLSNSKIKTLPKCLANLSNLQKLDITKTQVSTDNQTLKNLKKVKISR